MGLRLKGILILADLFFKKREKIEYKIVINCAIAHLDAIEMLDLILQNQNRYGDQQ